MKSVRTRAKQTCIIYRVIFHQIKKIYFILLISYPGLSDLVEALETVLLDEMLIPIEVYELGRDAIMNKVKTCKSTI